MHKFAVCLVAGLMVFGIGLGWSQGPGGKDGFKKGQGFEKKGMGPGFELGRVMPPPLMEILELSENQKKQIGDLEREVKARLLKILNAEQKNKVQNFKGPPNFKEDGKGKEKGGDKKDGQEKNGDKQAANSIKPQGAIVWFANVDQGLAEAQRTGKPILLVSAAPHCAGVPGVW